MLVESFRAINGVKEERRRAGSRQTALPIAFAVAQFGACRAATVRAGVQPVWTPPRRRGRPPFHRRPPQPSSRPTMFRPPNVCQRIWVARRRNSSKSRVGPTAQRHAGPLRGQVVVLDFFFNAAGGQADMPKVIGSIDAMPGRACRIGVHADIDSDVAQMKARNERSSSIRSCLDGGGAARFPERP